MLCAALAFGAPAIAEAPPGPPPYGAAISLDMAKKAVAAAHEEAKKNGWRMAIAVVEPTGTLVYYEKMDDTQYASPEIAQDKARSAAIFRRPTKAFNEAMAKGENYVLTLRGSIAAEGGVPILAGGKIVGAIGVSGGTGQQDGVVAKAGLDAIK
jgi:uncharacterized protein GlcG (DUF336 family)